MSIRSRAMGMSSMEVNWVREAGGSHRAPPYARVMGTGMRPTISGDSPCSPSLARKLWIRGAEMQRGTVEDKRVKCPLPCTKATHSGERRWQRMQR
ncbi:hypothetical protein B296_00013652 [Ensete ventricosum]|uniref:Uncharacterized protein n=1 Tax=Ensete ventricosum TaxID=4639 RepID=A0A426Z4B5_ENSVE|nr:hypothetical protein B296_00013652 [Ensete ventricosum]